MDLISLLIGIVVLCLVFGLIYWIVQYIPLPDPFKSIMIVAILVIFLLVLIGYLTGGVHLPAFR